ncbi:MAG: type II toxin-antitoxin system RelE/ParE family toxin [Acidimicrobiales bacterium]
MTRAVRFVDEASAELEAATQWYEDRRLGMGTSLLAAVEDTVKAIAAWPGAGALVEEVGVDLEVRRARIRRFPYHLAYLVTDEGVYVLAVAHDRRRPAFWRKRLGNPARWHQEDPDVVDRPEPG